MALSGGQHVRWHSPGVGRPGLIVSIGLLDSLKDASRDTQVLVTSHSPDLLDDEKLGTESILAVHAEKGAATIAAVDEVGRTALRDRLYTAGELLRLDQLRPDPKAIAEISQLRLFDEDEV